MRILRTPSATCSYNSPNKLLEKRGGSGGTKEEERGRGGGQAPLCPDLPTEAQLQPRRFGSPPTPALLLRPAGTGLPTAGPLQPSPPPPPTRKGGQAASASYHSSRSR